MLGKSVGILALVALSASCMSNVPQDKKSGEDGRVKNAKQMIFEENIASTKGIVTYPGGDRIDWKMIEIPEKKRGSLVVNLSWKSPRPGLRLAFDVFSDWGDKIGESKKKTGKRSRSRANAGRATGTVADARGKNYIRVYALERGDAGAYSLKVEFKETLGDIGFNPLTLEIPDPPRLASVPEAVDPCTDDNFDPKKPECKNFCPANGGPTGWKPCKDKCPDPPKIEIKACWAIVDCPNPPDLKYAKCKPADWPPCPDPKNPDLRNPNCPKTLPTLTVRVTARESSGSDLILTAAAGAEQGITPQWTASVIDTSSGRVLANNVLIRKIDKRLTKVATKLSASVINDNTHVKFTPPAIPKAQ